MTPIAPPSWPGVRLINSKWARPVWLSQGFNVSGLPFTEAKAKNLTSNPAPGSNLLKCALLAILIEGTPTQAELS
jgi:hypothetical protein